MNEEGCWCRRRHWWIINNYAYYDTILITFLCTNTGTGFPKPITFTFHPFWYQLPRCTWSSCRKYLARIGINNSRTNFEGVYVTALLSSASLAPPSASSAAVRLSGCQSANQASFLPDLDLNRNLNHSSWLMYNKIKCHHDVWLPMMTATLGFSIILKNTYYIIYRIYRFYIVACRKAKRPTCKTNIIVCE